ncbi:MAG: peptidylprolyl isomerase [Eubacteriales bacterium]
MKSILLAMLIALTTACASSTTPPDSTPETSPETTPEVVTPEITPDPPAEDSSYVVTHTGVMVINQDQEIHFELYGETAPISVENFVSLANSGFYEGIIFHRVIENFMIQGGDPTGTGMGGADNTIKGEFIANGVENPIQHTRGVLSMARSQSMDSASSQFFIMHADYPSLDGSYAAFGMVTSGMEVVDAIATTETKSDKPINDVVITSVTVVEV